MIIIAAMRRDFKNWHVFYQQITMIYNGIIAFSLLPFAWIFLEIEKGSGGLDLLLGRQLWVFDIVLSAIVGYVLWTTYRRSRITPENIPPEMKLRAKLSQYYSIKVNKFLIYESMALVAMIATYVNSDYFFVLIYVFILFLFSLDRPRYDRVVKEMNLSAEEKKQLESGDDLK